LLTFRKKKTTNTWEKNIIIVGWSPDKETINKLINYYLIINLN